MHLVDWQAAVGDRHWALSLPVLEAQAALEQRALEGPFVYADCPPARSHPVKNPVLIAILNFVFIGLGTLLLGKRPLVGLFALLGGSLLRYEEMRIAPLFTGQVTFHWVVAVSGLSILGLGMAVDGYREAKAA